MEALSIDSILARVQEVIAEEFGMAPEKVTPATRLVALGDSLERASLIVELECEFGEEISDEEAQKLFTVWDVVTYLDTRSLGV